MEVVGIELSGIEDASDNGAAGHGPVDGRDVVSDSDVYDTVC